MRRIWQFSELIRTMRRRLRFGSLSRLPLDVLRLELRGSAVECDWTIRGTDPWDGDLGAIQREQRLSEQAIRDAMVMREVIFASMREIDTAFLKGFRFWAVQHEPELLIQG